MASAASTPGFPGPGRLERVVVARYGRIMRTQPRESGAARFTLRLLKDGVGQISGQTVSVDVFRF